MVRLLDLVSWDCILDLLQRRFPSCFRNWLAALCSTTTSRVLLNGIADPPIIHGGGLRQGNPLLPLLFVIAINPLTHFENATSDGLLHKLRGRGTILRTSLYVDDAVVFLAPIKDDVGIFASILQAFGEVTRLCTNFDKSFVVPILRGQVNLDEVLQGIPAIRASFPLSYLGIPFSVLRLHRGF